MRNKIFLLLAVTGFIFPQEFQITYVPVIQYSIDRYTNEIYYRHDISGEIFKTNSTGTNHLLTTFPSVPQFSNNSHTAAYVSGNDLYQYDFEIDTSFFLAHSEYFYFGSYLIFSPSDDKILLSMQPLANIHESLEGSVLYYSFNDNSVHNLNITIYYDVMEWLTDTSIVYISLGGVDIRVLNINDLSINILVPEANLVSIRGLANNVEIGAFAYGNDFNQTENAFVNLYFHQTGIDTTVYNFLEQGPGQEDYTILIRSLTWEKKRNKLAFIGAAPLQYLSLIYVFDYTSFNTYLYSDWLTNGDGFKYNLQWLNQDTVIYSDYYDGGYLFGLDVTTPVSVREDKNSEFIVDHFELYQAFPNPFNPSTTIKFGIPEAAKVSLKVYDVIGREVSTLVNEEKRSGFYEVVFNASSLSSGIYFYQLKASDFVATKKLILLK